MGNVRGGNAWIPRNIPSHEAHPRIGDNSNMEASPVCTHHITMTGPSGWNMPIRHLQPRMEEAHLSLQNAKLNKTWGPHVSNSRNCMPP